MIPVRVFTHPTCSTCPMAIKLVQRLAEDNPNVELRIISLGSAQGREVAKAHHILSVPTVLVGETRFVGVPRWDDLVEAAQKHTSTGDKQKPRA